MPLTRLVLLGGIAVSLSGATLAVVGIFRYNQVYEHAFAGEGAFIMLGVALSLLGLLGLCVHRENAAFFLGIVGFPIAFVGTIVFVGLAVGWVQAFVLPTLTQEAREAIISEQLAGPLPIVLALSFVPVAIGWMLLGLATFKALVHAHLSAAFLLVGALILSTSLLLPVPVIVGLLGLYAACVGGVLLWRARAVAAGEDG
jgi:hypothetical protein